MCNCVRAHFVIDDELCRFWETFITTKSLAQTRNDFIIIRLRINPFFNTVQNSESHTFGSNSSSARNYIRKMGRLLLYSFCKTPALSLMLFSALVTNNTYDCISILTSINMLFVNLKCC